MTHLTVDTDVVRAVTTAPEFRAASNGDLGVLTGHFSVFDTWYRVESMFEGEFMERTAPGFTARTIAEDRSGMRVLFNHGFDGQIGDKVLGMIRKLEEDKVGPYYEVPLFDTSYNRDLVPGFSAGAYGASFRMRVQEDSWDDEPEPSDYNPKGLPERTILRAKVAEFGPVTFPANPEATAEMAGAFIRSISDDYYAVLMSRNADAFEAALRARGHLDTPPRPRPKAPANPQISTGASTRATSADDGGTASKPGNGEQANTTEAQKFRDMLFMSKMRLPKPTTATPEEQPSWLQPKSKKSAGI